jgi:hypothetical protein
MKGEKEIFYEGHVKEKLPIMATEKHVRKIFIHDDVASCIHASLMPQAEASVK